MPRLQRRTSEQRAAGSEWSWAGRAVRAAAAVFVVSAGAGRLRCRNGRSSSSLHRAFRSVNPRDAARAARPEISALARCRASGPAGRAITASGAQRASRSRSLQLGRSSCTASQPPRTSAPPDTGWNHPLLSPAPQAMQTVANRGPGASPGHQSRPYSWLQSPTAAALTRRHRHCGSQPRAWQLPAGPAASLQVRGAGAAVLDCGVAD